MVRDHNDVAVSSAGEHRLQSVNHLFRRASPTVRTGWHRLRCSLEPPWAIQNHEPQALAHIDLLWARRPGWRRHTDAPVAEASEVIVLSRQRPAAIGSVIVIAWDENGLGVGRHGV